MIQSSSAKFLLAKLSPSHVLAALRRGRRQPLPKDIVYQRTAEDAEIIRRCNAKPWNTSEAPTGRLSMLLKRVRTAFHLEQPKVADTLPLRPIGLLVAEGESVKVVPISCAYTTDASPIKEESKEVTLAGPGTNKKPVRPIHVPQPVSIANLLWDMQLRREHCPRQQAMLMIQPGEKVQRARSVRARQPPMRRMACRSPLAQEASF